MLDLKLGKIYMGTKLVNHRSLLKILINPILRYFGFYIGTKSIDGILGGIIIKKCKRENKIDFKRSLNYNLKGVRIVKERIFI